MKGVVARKEEWVDDFGENLLTSMGCFSHRMSYWRFFEKRLLILLATPFLCLLFVGKPLPKEGVFSHGTETFCTRDGH